MLNLTTRQIMANAVAEWDSYKNGNFTDFRNFCQKLSVRQVYEAIEGIVGNYAYGVSDTLNVLEVITRYASEPYQYNNESE